MRFLIILLAVGLTAVAQPPASQTPPSQTPPRQTTEPARGDLVFSVTSTLVQIDAVVLDKKGRQVTDLRPEDFEVLIDGKPQKITNFSYIRVTPDAPKPQQAPSDKKRVDLATQLPPSSEIKRDDVHRTIVLMVDDLGLSFEDMAFTRRALHRFVERQMQPGDLVAVCRTAVGSGALADLHHGQTHSHLGNRSPALGSGGARGARAVLQPGAGAARTARRCAQRHGRGPGSDAAGVRAHAAGFL